MHLIAEARNKPINLWVGRGGYVRLHNEVTSPSWSANEMGVVVGGLDWIF